MLSVVCPPSWPLCFYSVLSWHLKQLTAGRGAVYWGKGNDLLGEMAGLKPVDPFCGCSEQRTLSLKAPCKILWIGRKYSLSCNWYSCVCKGAAIICSNVWVRDVVRPATCDQRTQDRKTAFTKQKSRALVWLQGSQRNSSWKKKRDCSTALKN